MNTKHIKHQLQAVIEDKPNALEAYVAKEALEHEDREHKSTDA